MVMQRFCTPQKSVQFRQEAPSGYVLVTACALEARRSGSIPGAQTNSCIKAQTGCSSAVECHVGNVEAVGSIPTSLTNKFRTTNDVRDRMVLTCAFLFERVRV